MNVPLLISELSRDEGIRLKPYTDSVGKITIGIGRNLTDKGISREEAYHLLNNDIDEVIGELDKRLPWWRRLDDVRQRVLANMAFNLGITKLLTFERTLASIMLGSFGDAATEMLQSQWAKEVGPRAQRLAQMMRIGLAPEEMS